MDKKQIEREIEELKKGLKEVESKSPELLPENTSMQALIKYLVEEREKTNRLLLDITQKIRMLEEEVGTLEINSQAQEDYTLQNSKEIGLSNTDAKILDFVQTKGMACADDVKKFMSYRGNNAACARLNRLHKLGLLDRLQLGHKVYYKFDAGKTTNTLIVSPPQ